MNSQWLAFARANQAAELVATGIVGRPIWQFLTGLETEHIYRLLHRRVRAERSPARITFRCDSPERRRLLRLEVSGEADEALVYRVRTLQETPRAPLPPPAPAGATSELFVTVCSWCNRVSAPEGWLELEQAVAELALFEAVLPPQFTHGICPTCVASIGHAFDQPMVEVAVGAW